MNKLTNECIKESIIDWISRKSTDINTGATNYDRLTGLWKQADRHKKEWMREKGRERERDF